MMRIDILTLFPSMFSPLEESIIGKAKDKGILDIAVTDIRSFAKDKHRTADDTPYGGGPGMVMKPELIFEAVEHIKSSAKGGSASGGKTNPKSKCQNLDQKTILLTPAGKTFDQDTAKELSKYDHLILICGHYEGVDERVKDIVDEEISIGDYVLTGGELAAMVIIDAVSRFIPKVLGDESSSKEDSFSDDLLEHPQYTKPGSYLNKKVPEVLLGGNHGNIAGWRREQAVVNTFFKRPDLLSKADITSSDMASLERIFTGD
ncbi:MAG: tRNA (guanosine(37)-N1)-methyltransferase TrmD [bacterium]